MTETLTVYQALALVMGDVQAVGKDGRNTQQNFSFRGIDATVNAVGPALRKHGVLVMPKLRAKEYREYQTTKGTTMRECLVEVEYTFVGPDGSRLSCVVPGESSDAGDKGTAKAMSVAYRIALLQALCIPTDEPDPDETSVERAPAVDESARVAQRTLLAEVKTSHPELDADGAAKRARELWDKHGQDPKKLPKMIEAAKEPT